MCAKGSVEREGRCIAVLKGHLTPAVIDLLDLRPSEDQAGDRQERPADVAARHRASGADAAACAELRSIASDELSETERRLNGSAHAILPAFIPLGPLRLDLDRLERNAGRPFDPSGEVSALRRQWAIWKPIFAMVIFGTFLDRGRCLMSLWTEEHSCTPERSCLFWPLRPCR